MRLIFLENNLKLEIDFVTISKWFLRNIQIIFSIRKYAQNIWYDKFKSVYALVFYSFTIIIALYIHINIAVALYSS